jgi:NADH dehydrogenase [ubiquinone] 1 alpha subcomplex assembly factor 7
LLIDYGHDAPRTGSTLQALRQHRMVDPLAMPGEADLTAHVDFAALAPIAQSRGARWLGTVTQGHWLRHLGIEVRAERLARVAPEHRDAIFAAMERLIGEGQMGALFKVMGLAAPDWHGGEGF